MPVLKGNFLWTYEENPTPCLVLILGDEVTFLRLIFEVFIDWSELFDFDNISFRVQRKTGCQ